MVVNFKIDKNGSKTLSFVIGTDSLRNPADVNQRIGVHDVSGAATDMYWSRNSGYITH